ncbi:hypothetical protein [Brevibacterium senegalense]|uniref:hypothetical protein n=1 Tax=Brevibacterium senegalense TaxID=1033736 RepID=UPI0002EA0995|nr:hypothetical protein [Brevibacterium senegalense]
MNRGAAGRWAVSTAAAAAVLLVSGCGLVGVRLSDEAGAPLRVGAQPTMGPEPEPTETTDPALEGMELKNVTFSGDCPARVGLYLPDDWTSNSTGSSFAAFPTTGGFDGPRLSVLCSDAFADSASASVSSTQEYQFTDDETQVVAEHMGQVGPGYSWVYEANLGSEETMASFSDEPTTAVAASIAYPISGKLYDLSVTYYFNTDDTETRDQAVASLSNLQVEGVTVSSPADW